MEWLNEGGELGRRIAGFDWSKTPLGPLSGWPQSLLTSLSLMLSSQHPMWIGWGPEATFLYNDAYIPVLSAAKHPWALGQPAAVVWAEIWDFCGPLAEKVFKKAEATYVEDVELIMNRGDWLEETYYSFSYSPIRDEAGKVGGLFCPSAEVSAQLINARRLRTLSELTATALLEKTVEGACASAFAILAKNPRDLPFAALYLLGDDPQRAQRIASFGLPSPDSPLAPEWIDLDPATTDAIWPVREATESGQLIEAALPPSVPAPTGPGNQPTTRAAVVPVTAHGLGRPLAVLVAGVSPARQLNADYRTFYQLVATQLATAIQNASAAEEERKRLAGLAELDRAKIEFFSNVSHEFRTPLTLMLGPLEDELRDAPAPNPRVDLAYRNSLRLLKLVNTLLDFSRIEAGRVDAAFEETDLAAYTAELASVFQSAVDRAGLRLIIDCPPLPQPAFVDRIMWEKIVFNFLSNAFKFTFEGEIEVKVRSEGAHAALVTVRDSGAGIPPEELPRLFERFHRGLNPRARSYEGSGIGLSLVQELVHLHGGSVTAASTVGVGTTFTVRLPLGRDHLPADRIRAAGPLAISSTAAKALMVEADQWLSNAGASAVDPPPRAALAIEDDAGTPVTKNQGASILVCDDNSDLREYLGRLMGSHGYRVVTVGDGAAALEEARRRRPDLVLSDVMMPRLDGFGLLEALRKDETTRTIPIILLSARAGEEARIEGMSSGADGYLTKPFSARELLAQVASQLELARVRREAAMKLEQERQKVEELAEELTQSNELLSNRSRHLDLLVQERTHKLQEVIGELEAFSYSIAHDLRSPLRSVQSFSEALMVDYAANLPAEAQGFLRRIGAASERMDRLILDVLSYSRVVRGELVLEPVSLDKLVNEIVSTYPAFAPDKAHIQLVGPLPVVLGNEAMLTQIFSNLLGNAVKFIRAGTMPQIRIWAESERDRARIFVADRGIGIAPDQIDKVFDTFYQIDKSLGGTGIGLAIVKKAVGRLGGALSVNSTLGEGSTFVIELKLAGD